MYALNPATGERVWQYDAGAGIAGGADAFRNSVFAADVNGAVHAVGRVSGERLWMTDNLGGASRGPVATDGQRVFSAHEDGTVYSLDAADGAVRWRFEVGDEIRGGAATANGLVYFTSSDDFVYALNARWGRLVWKTELKLDSQSTPTAAGKLVLVGSRDHHVYALDAATGKLVWNFWAGDSVTASIAASKDAAFFGSDDGYVYSVSLDDGSMNWRREVGEAVRATAAVAGGIVYVGYDSGELLALDASDGALVWNYRSGGTGRPRDAVADGDTVYFGSEDGAIYAIAAGFPDGYAHSVFGATAPEPRTKFSPMSKGVMFGRMHEMFSWRDRHMLTKVTVFRADGPQEVIGSDLALEIFESGYYLLTDRTVQQDGWVVNFLSLEDYEELAYALGDPELLDYRGWCCTRADDGLGFYIRADITVDTALAVMANEAGRALQKMLNPVQDKAANDSLIGALREAQAYTFEVALARKLAEYLEVEIAGWPYDYHYGEYLNNWRDSMEDSVGDIAQERARGRLLMWQAVLHDPELKHLKSELRWDGRVSADSLMDMYNRFVSLTPGEVEAYVQSISSESLTEDLDFIYDAVYKRIGQPGDFNELVIHVPEIMLSP